MLVVVFVQFLCYVRIFVTPWTAAQQDSMSFTISQILLKLMATYGQWVGSLPQVAKVLEPQLQHQSFQRVWGLISFRIDRFDLLAAQRTLKSLLHYSSKTSILWHSAFFMVQISHLYMTIGKTIALTIRSLPAKWCLCFLIYSLGLS